MTTFSLLENLLRVRKYAMSSNIYSHLNFVIMWYMTNATPSIYTIIYITRKYNRIMQCYMLKYSLTKLRYADTHIHLYSNFLNKLHYIKKNINMIHILKQSYDCTDDFLGFSKYWIFECFLCLPIATGISKGIISSL